MKPRYWMTCASLLLLASAGWVSAQQPPAPPGEDPIGGNLFPPELIMQHQQAIGLSEEQKSFLKSEIRQAQTRFTEWQWKLQDEMEKLAALVKQPRVDEEQTLGQLEKLLGVERDIKRMQITLLVRLKNKLTPEQQAKLEELRGRPGGK